MKNQQFELTLQIFKEGDTFIAYNPELDISSCGKNQEQARKNFSTAVSLFLEEAKKMGTLQELLNPLLTKEGINLPPPLLSKEGIKGRFALA